MTSAVRHIIEATIAHQPGSETTQRPNTDASYKKAANVISPLLPQTGATVLDFGSGMGLGTAAMRSALGTQVTVDNYEPAPGARATYTQTDRIPTHYDAVVCLNVLNVLEPGLRDSVVKFMASLVKPGGVLVIGVRKWTGDVEQTQGTPGDEPKSIWLTARGKKVYQKGFDGVELQSYVQSALPRYLVTRIPKLTANAVLAKRPVAKG